jgi:PIN domain nuclease of toxin-antitoxin system
MFVTDTHAVIWASTGKFSQLSPKVLSVFEKADKGEVLIYIPAVVLWEVAILQHLGKITLSVRFDYWAKNLLRKQGFELIPLEPSIIANAVGYNFNNDVFDKVIVASAVEFELPLITKDNAITDSNLVEIYW